MVENYISSIFTYQLWSKSRKLPLSLRYKKYHWLCRNPWSRDKRYDGKVKYISTRLYVLCLMKIEWPIILYHYGFIWRQRKVIENIYYIQTQILGWCDFLKLMFICLVGIIHILSVLIISFSPCQTFKHVNKWSHTK